MPRRTGAHRTLFCPSLYCPREITGSRGDPDTNNPRYIACSQLFCQAHEIFPARTMHPRVSRNYAPRSLDATLHCTIWIYWFCELLFWLRMYLRVLDFFCGECKWYFIWYCSFEYIRNKVFVKEKLGHVVYFLKISGKLRKMIFEFKC